MTNRIFSMMLAIGITVPALAQTGSAAIVPLQNQETILDAKSYVDTYDPAQGAYDSESNASGAPTFTTGNAMPDLTAPTGQGTFERVRYFTDKEDVTLTGKLSCDTFRVGTFTNVTIEGKCVLFVRESFVIENHSNIILAPGAKLTVYCLNNAIIRDHAHVNPDSSRPNAVVFIKLGNRDLVIEDQSSMTATVFAPKAQLVVQNGSHFFGMLKAKSLTIQNHAAGHFTHFNAVPPTTVAPLYD